MSRLPSNHRARSPQLGVLEEAGHILALGENENFSKMQEMEPLIAKTTYKERKGEKEKGGGTVSTETHFLPHFLPLLDGVLHPETRGFAV